MSERQTLADDCAGGNIESLAVCKRAVIEPKALLVQIPEQVKRFYADVGAFQAALEQRPKAFDPVGVNLPVNVPLRVVDHFMNVLRIKLPIGRQIVGVNICACFDVILDNVL